MSNFNFLKQYIFTENDEKAALAKHSFYKLLDNDILDAEKRLGYAFPEELRAFYSEIGYGFMCNENQDFFDRIMDPASVADFMLCEGMYEGNAEEEHYASNYLVFFEVSEVSFLAIEMSEAKVTGKCPVYYFDTKIADSFLEFLNKMDETMDYYLNFENN